MAYNKRIYSNSTETVTHEDFNRIETGIEVNDIAISDIKDENKEGSLAKKIANNAEQINNNTNQINDLINKLTKALLNQNLNTRNIDEKIDENYVVGISEDGYGTRPFTEWNNIIQFSCSHFISQLGFRVNGTNARLAFRSRYVSDDFAQEWAEVLTHKSVESIGIPFNSGYESIGYGCAVRIDKIGRNTTIQIGVKKSDGTKFTGGTKYLLFILPAGFTKLIETVTNSCIGENGGNADLTFGQISIEENAVYVIMKEDCYFIKGQISYIAE